MLCRASVFVPAAVCPTAPTFILYPGRAKPIDGYAHGWRAFEVLRRERAEWGAEVAA